MKNLIAACVVAGLALAVPGWAQRSATAKETNADELKAKLDKGEKVLVIDVRTDEEIKSGSIPGALHIPMEQLEARMQDVPKDVQLVFTWNGGGRSSRAAELFEKNGYKAATFCPLNNWKAKGYGTGAPKKAPEGPVKP